MHGQHADYNVLTNDLGDFPDVQRKIVHTIESYKDDIMRIS